MSWQPGDVSPDARRAAEAAADSAGMPLKDWFAATVRAAILRELGSLPTAEVAIAGLASEPPEPEVRPAEPVPVSMGKSDRPAQPFADAAPPAPQPIAEPEPRAPDRVAAKPPPPIVEPEPLAPEPIVVTEPPAPPPITEPEPIAAAATQEPPPIVEPVPPPAPKDVQMAPDYRQPVSLGVQRLADHGLSSWLATRIQGLPSATSAVARSGADRAASTAPRIPSLSPTPSMPRLNLPPTGPVAVQPPAPMPQPPARVSAAPAATASPAPARPVSAAPPQATVLPLSLPAGPVTTLPLASLRPARIRARRPSDADPAIAGLAGSVASHGVREPVLVRRLAEKADQYEV
ncbi:MAG: hypothetical protein ACREFI_04265, partial [Stellaceae bacterium]